MRRAVARANLRRAEEVVCLTEAMGNLVRASAKRPVTVTMPLAPADLAGPVKELGPATEDASRTVLVPGTVTWYKRPQLALGVAKELGECLGVTPLVLFAGHDDGSGAWEDTHERASRADIEIVQRPLARQEMVTALQSTVATVIPSELESLSLSLSEALVLSPRVVASNIPAHREVSAILGRPPQWLESGKQLAMPRGEPVHPSPDEIIASWQAVGNALSLPKVC